MNRIDLPEQELAVRSINNMIATGKFPHALLLTGKNGFGPLKLVMNIAKVLLSQGNEQDNKQQVLKVENASHPDLHLFFPINTTKTVKSKPRKTDFINDWREFTKISLYQDHSHWFQYIGIENKQGIINVQQARDVVDSLKLKPYEAQAKVAIIWGAEFMNREAGNKLLKVIEEPPANSYLILMSESKEDLLSTILSRCQEIPLTPLSNSFITDHLVAHYKLDNIKADMIAEQSEHSLSKAIRLVQQTDDDADHEKRFIDWVRIAFLVRKNTSAMQDLMEWSTQLSREKKGYQRSFLLFCQQFFRQAYLNNLKLYDLVFYKPKDTDFSFDKFSKFIHHKNYSLIMNNLEDSIFHLDRNVNQKALLTDMSLQLTKLIHLKD
jgi:DNA polymerase-3 subunit delta'